MSGLEVPTSAIVLDLHILFFKKTLSVSLASLFMFYYFYFIFLDGLFFNFVVFALFYFVSYFVIMFIICCILAMEFLSFVMNFLSWKSETAQ